MFTGYDRTSHSGSGLLLGPSPWWSRWWFPTAGTYEYVDVWKHHFRLVTQWFTYVGTWFPWKSGWLHTNIWFPIPDLLLYDLCHYTLPHSLSISLTPGRCHPVDLRSSWSPLHPVIHPFVETMYSRDTHLLKPRHFHSLSLSLCLLKSSSWALWDWCGCWLLFPMISLSSLSALGADELTLHIATLTRLD